MRKPRHKYYVCYWEWNPTKEGHAEWDWDCLLFKVNPNTVQMRQVGQWGVCMGYVRYIKEKNPDGGPLLEHILETGTILGK